MAINPEVFIPESLELHIQDVGVVDPHTMSCRQVAEGRTNQVWQAQFTQEGRPVALAVRMPLPGRDAPESVAAYVNEAHVRTTLLPPDFAHAPRLFYVEIDPLHAVEEYIEGQHPTHDGERWTDEMIIAFANAVGSLHASTEQPANVSDPGEALLREYEVTTQKALHLSRGTAVESYMERLDAIAQEKLAELSQELTLGGTHVVNHNDLVNSNILFRDDGHVGFIDWEYAKLADPAQSLAAGTYISDRSTPLSDYRSGDIRLNGRNEELFLEAYQQRAGVIDPDFIQRVRLWQAARYTAVLVRFAGILYNPKAADALWLPPGPKPSEEIEAALRSNGYPVFTP